MKHDRPKELLKHAKVISSVKSNNEFSDDDATLERFKRANSQEGIRVFVAGGSRSGNDEIYTHEAYLLGQLIVKMDFKLDFGLSNSGIMGAVARGVLDGWSAREIINQADSPIQGITTEKYFSLYPSDDELIGKMEVIVAGSLEERKQKLLNADYVVFAPGGVGTLDELAYDCVAMQDGMLPLKPFIIYNINGFFHHLLEYLKHIAHEGFAEPVPFIVVDNAKEMEIAFKLLKTRCDRCADNNEAYTISRQLIYELPYFIKKTASGLKIDECLAQIEKINTHGNASERQFLQSEMENAYLEREIEKMYDRLVQTGRDTGAVSDKLANLKKRHKEIL